VKLTSLVLPVLALSFALPAVAQSAGKIGVISIQGAIVGTQDGQKAAKEIQTRFNPKKAELDRRQSEISQLQDQLNKGRNTLSEEGLQKLTREIEQKTKMLNRDSDDARAELDQEEQKTMGQLFSRIQVVIDKYAKDHGYTLILDVSSPQTPVLYRSETIDITKDIVELYDKNSSSAASATPPPGANQAAARPPATRPAAPAAKPAVPPK
jgi:outer membrane protein